MGAPSVGAIAQKLWQFLNSDITLSINIAAASLPLPAGAATAALQLPDGHNVTANAGAALTAWLDGTTTTAKVNIPLLSGEDQSNLWLSVSLKNIAAGVSLPAGGNNIGDVDIASLPNEGQQTMANSISVAVASDQSDVPVNPKPATSGGLSIFRSLDLDESEEEVKATAGQVYGWYIANTATATRFVKFYNATAANVTVGTTIPVLTFPIPGNSSDDVGANALGAHGIAFGTAITVAATTGVADADTGAPGANDVIVNIFYK